MADNECQLQTFLFKQTSRCSLRARPRPIAPITTAWQDHCQHCISFQLLTTTFWGEFFARWWRWLVHPQRSFGASDIGTSWRLSTVTATATTTTTTTTAMTTTALTSCWQDISIVNFSDSWPEKHRFLRGFTKILHSGLKIPRMENKMLYFGCYGGCLCFLTEGTTLQKRFSVWVLVQHNFG